jgi:hypothetical protein
MKQKIFVLLTCVLFLPNYVCADSDKITNTVNGHQYQRIDKPKTWHQARSYCKDQQGYLVTLTSSLEDSFVYDNLGVSEQSIWLGATDESEEGTWVWVTGEPWSYTNWSTEHIEQPDNAHGGQDYLTYYSINPGKWDDSDSPLSLERVFICEFEFN